MNNADRVVVIGTSIWIFTNLLSFVLFGGTGLIITGTTNFIIAITTVAISANNKKFYNWLSKR